ncbi:hypothetical protein BA059_27150 [Mycolicibacterium sp. (ex Dasyatis americana)]|nr:hypothetical protein BA059_27150 [Mycolicibacterium sp. (ex Dasyatis americana)]
MEADAGSGELTTAPPRRSRGARVNRWLWVLAIVLTVLAGGAATGGYLAIQAHHEALGIARAETEALAAAKDCISATQPADATAVAASQEKLISCATGDFATQTQWYGAVLEQAYQAADVHVQLPQLHVAVERHNADGSIVALVAFRAVITQPGMADRENSYRVRVKMVDENGAFKVANMDQVAQ